MRDRFVEKSIDSCLISEVVFAASKFDLFYHPASVVIHIYLTTISISTTFSKAL